MKYVDRKQAARLKRSKRDEQIIVTIGKQAAKDFNKNHGTAIHVLGDGADNLVHYGIMNIYGDIIHNCIKDPNIKQPFSFMAKTYNVKPDKPETYKGYNITPNQFYFDENKTLNLYDGLQWHYDFGESNSNIKKNFPPNTFRKAGMFPDGRVLNLKNQKGIWYEVKHQENAGNADERFFRWKQQWVENIINDTMNQPYGTAAVLGFFTGEQVESTGAQRCIHNAFEGKRENYLLIDMESNTYEEKIYEHFYNNVFPKVV